MWPVRPYRWKIAKGFTLLEVLLALSLAAVLILGVFSVMRLQARFTHDGTGRVEESQLARSVLQLIAADIRNCSLNPGITGDEQRLVLSRRRLAAEPLQQGQFQREETASGLKVRAGTIAVGNPLQNSLSRADVEHEYATEAPAFDRFAYLLIEDALDVSQWFTQTEPLADSMADEPDEQPQHGLVRLRLDELSEFGESTPPLRVGTSAMESPETIAETQPIRVIAPEVRYLRFQYLGEYGWTSSWDGTAGLPRGVEIELGLAAVGTAARHRSSASSPDEHDARETEASVADEMSHFPDSDLHFYRLIVRVPAGPAADPRTVATEPLEYRLPRRVETEDERKHELQPSRRKGVRP
jgi:prepilin-type N-terminal cleavage/methylation domain-containing protein